MKKFFKGWRKIFAQKNNLKSSEELCDYFSGNSDGVVVGKYTISIDENIYPKFTKKSIIK